MGRGRFGVTVKYLTQGISVERSDLVRAIMSLIHLLGIGDEVYEILRKKREVRVTRIETRVGFM